MRNIPKPYAAPVRQMGSQKLIPQTQTMMIVSFVMFFALLMPLIALTFFIYYLSIPALALGVTFWFLYSKKQVQSQLRTIEKQGVYSTPRRYWLYFGAVACIVIVIAIAITRVIPENVLGVSAFFIVDFSIPSAPVSSFIRLKQFNNWEQANNRTLYYTTGFHGKIFPYPYMFENQVPEVQKNKAFK